MGTADEEARRRLAGIPLDDLGVLAVVLFGSTARHEQRPGSDVDVAFLLEEPFDPTAKLELIARVERALGTEEVDVVVLNGLPEKHPLLAVRILAQGEVLVDRAPAARLALHRRALRMAEDARHLMRIADEARRSALDG